MKAVEKIKTHILCPIPLFRKSCRLWDSVEKFGGAREARARAPTHTHTHRYVILIAFPRQQLFRERCCMLRYTYIACLDMYLSLMMVLMPTPVAELFKA